MKVLLLCGYRPTDSLEPVLGLARDENGATLIDQRIVALRELGLEIVTVLGGRTADEQLRQSRCIQYTDLAFDTSESPSLLNNTLAGHAVMTGTSEAYFVMPVEVPLPPQELWHFLINAYAKAGYNTA